MRVTMIEPKPPGKHVFSTVNMPRLGLPLLGTILRDAGHEVRLLYDSGEDIKVSDLMWADIVGISTTTSTSTEAYHIARFARSKGKPVVMGGAHVTFLPEEALEHCDYVVRGEGDTSFLALLECIAEKREPLSVPGVSFRRGGEIIHNPLPEWVDVTRSPIPDLTMMSCWKKMSTVPVMTSRGCPFDCSFCSVTAMFGRQFRCREMEQILEETALYRDRQVFFIDDNFTANPRWSKQLLTEMIRRNAAPKWWCAQVRTDAARDEELLELMKRAGCGTVFIGMESVNPETLKKYNKKQGVEDIEKSIRKFHEYGIMVHGMFVLGADDDTAETVRETANFAIENRIDTVQFLVLTPLPGTRTFAELEAEGRLLTRDWSLYDGHHVVYRPKRMTPLELQVETVNAMKKFYSAGRILENVAITGKKSAAMRAVGFWMTRRWESENRWYYEHLRRDMAPAERTASGFYISKTIEALKIPRLWYVTKEKLMDIEIFEQNGTFMVELKGLLNQFTLKEVVKTLKRRLPATARNLSINIDQACFSSEETVKRFVSYLNDMANRAKRIQVNTRVNTGLGAWLQNVLEKHNLSVPRFELPGSRPGWNGQG